MLKKRMLALAVVSAMGLFLTACGQKEEAAAPAATVAAVAPSAEPAEEKVLNIYNWPDYISESMIPDFEKETGIKVNYQTFETNEALHAKFSKTWEKYCIKDVKHKKNYGSQLLRAVLDFNGNYAK